MAPHRVTDAPPREYQLPLGGRVGVHFIDLAVSVALVVASIGFFIDGRSLAASVVGRSLHELAWGWNAAQLVSQTLCIAGVLRPWPRVEVVGRFFASAGFLVTAVSIIELRPPDAAFPWQNASIYLLLALGFAGRGLIVVHRGILTIHSVNAE